jgi:UDP-N-acetylglucosamine:LPS N-acetylglucosamine transferase
MRRVLYISGSIGLGHVSKDLAIARELRRRQPEIEILWLAGHPASNALRQAGETVIPESENWIGASQIAEKCTRNGQLNLVRYVYRSLPSWAANARLFRKILDSHEINVAVGNEVYEVQVGLTLRLLRVRVPFVMIFDFVGTDATTANPLDQLGSWALNAIWAGDGRVFQGNPHSAIFIGELEDVPDERMGWALPNRRTHATKHYREIGHVINFMPGDCADRTVLRRKLGFGDGPLVVCAVGGTSIGRDLLQLCGEAFVPLRKSMRDVHMVLVCGPRIPVESIMVPAGVDVRGYVPRLYEMYACSDVAVVQCGASSTTELAALRRPFIYFPIDGHFEQEAVASRLARYGAGVRMSVKAATPDMLAEAIVREYGRTVGYAPMPVDGAAKAAAHILEASC